jgi:hypothetical protein
MTCVAVTMMLGVSGTEPEVAMASIFRRSLVAFQ